MSRPHMTLRAKIILLFVGLAMLPLMVVAAFGSKQAGDLTGRLVAGILSEPAWDVARELEAALGELDGDLARLATRAPDDWTDDWADESALVASRVAHLRLVSRGERLLAERGAEPETSERCSGVRHSHFVEFRHPAPVAGEGATLVAGIWLDQLALPSLEPRSGNSIEVLHRQTGQVLLASSCPAATAPSAAGMGLPPLPLDGGGLYLDQDGRERFGGLAPVAGRPWVVLASMPGEAILQPLREIQRSLWLLILLLTLATGLAFSVLLGDVVRSLEQLTDAASRIGEGELNPWLPPPGDDEVGRLSLAFGQMLDRFRRMIQHVDQEGRLAVVGRLTAYLAHEIRNPLSSIRLNLQSLAREARDGRLPDDAGELVSVSLKEVDRLADSVSRVLELGGGEPAGALEEVGLHEVVQEAAALLAEQGRAAQVTLRLELDAAADRVLARPGPLKGVFVNLLVNAMQAQPDGGEIVMRSRLTALANGGPGVAVHVRDRGHGVPPGLREQIFRPFFTTRSDGSGIGLATSQRTLRDFGGDLYLADLPETATGSEFVVELPLAALAPDQVPAPRAQLPTWMRARPRQGLAARALSGPEPQESTP
jgi:signal transduction histidine kinase